jgi:hypothetical protein
MTEVFGLGCMASEGATPLGLPLALGLPYAFHAAAFTLALRGLDLILGEFGFCCVMKSECTEPSSTLEPTIVDESCARSVHPVERVSTHACMHACSMRKAPCGAPPTCIALLDVE